MTIINSLTPRLDVSDDFAMRRATAAAAPTPVTTMTVQHATAAISVVQEGHPYVLQGKQLPADSVWQAALRNNKWTLLLRVPVRSDMESQIALVLW